jgi:hypothetical protein
MQIIGPDIVDTIAMIWGLVVLCCLVAFFIGD